MDKEKIMQGVRLILDGIGEDIQREGLIDTPERVARMYEEIFSGLTQDASEHLNKTFAADGSDMVLERIYFSILHANIILCRFSVMRILPIYQTAG